MPGILLSRTALTSSNAIAKAMFGPQLIFVVSWLQCAFVARSRWITKCAKKKEQVLAAHIFTEAAYLWSHGMRYVAGVYLRVDARLNFHNLIENFAAIQT